MILLKTRQRLNPALPAVLAALLFCSNAAEGGMDYTKPAQKDKCPVCGMFVAKYPDWIAEIVFRDGTYVVFDGPKDFFQYLLEPEKYTPGRRNQDIQAVFVTDYYGLTQIDGYTAFYVTGSDVYGPMGAELIPFKKESDAREFLKDHRGKQILRFKEVTPAVLRGLR
jgi:nitrous oxide reductase accessory protein NosL